MKKTKIAVAVIAITAIATLAIGLAFAHYFGNSYNSGYSRDYANSVEEQEWWDEMRRRMEYRFEGIEDEEWFDDMLAYMEKHWNEVQDQEWSNEMREYMEENRISGYYNGKGGYYGGSRGCWGW